jgi:transposase
MIVEHVDDIPIISAKIKESGLSTLLNQHFKVHGNWDGLDIGQTVEVWLIYILSCGEHRLYPVEDWVSDRLHVLQGVLQSKILLPQHLSDDRLERVLDYLSATPEWELFESSFNGQLLQVYGLPEEKATIRLDATLAQSFRASADLFQEGYAKQHRADLPQIKIMLSTYDPLGMPLTVEVVSGDSADEPLYKPAIDKVRKTLLIRGNLYVGDKKMGTLDTRSYLSETEDYYLMPLPLRTCSEEQILRYLANQPTDLFLIEEEDKSGRQILKAKLFEVEGGQECTNGNYQWTERRIVAYSVAYGASQAQALDKKITNACVEIDALLRPKQGKKVLSTLEEVNAAIVDIHNKYRTKDLLFLEIKTISTPKTQRKYGTRPAQIIEELTFEISVSRNETMINEKKTLFGWRVYATNAPKERLSPIQCVECYWQEYHIEHRFNELHHKTTALLPLFLHKQNRIVALVRLLITAIKFSCLIQYQVRQELKNTGQSINELYPGNPGRKTTKPTTNLILGAFKGISLVIMKLPDGNTFIQMTNLKPVQLNLIKLLGLKSDLFEMVCQFCKSD